MTSNNQKAILEGLHSLFDTARRDMRVNPSALPKFEAAYKAISEELSIPQPADPPSKNGMTANLDQNIYKMTTDTLHQLGVPAHIMGYRYLRQAIMGVMKDSDLINAMTKKLYPSIADQFGTTPSRVERAIRHAVEVCWDRGDLDVLHGYFGFTVSNTKGKPTNSEFIALIVDKLRNELYDV